MESPLKLIYGFISRLNITLSFNMNFVALESGFPAIAMVVSVHAMKDYSATALRNDGYLFMIRSVAHTKLSFILSVVHLGIRIRRIDGNYFV